MEAEVTAQVRVSGEGIKPLRACQHLLRAVSMNKILLHRLPHEA
jgi:hypothetical protein